MCYIFFCFLLNIFWRNLLQKALQIKYSSQKLTTQTANQWILNCCNTAGTPIRNCGVLHGSYILTIEYQLMHYSTTETTKWSTTESKLQQWLAINMGLLIPLWHGKQFSEHMLQVKQLSHYFSRNLWTDFCNVITCTPTNKWTGFLSPSSPASVFHFNDNSRVDFDEVVYQCSFNFHFMMFR